MQAGKKVSPDEVYALYERHIREDMDANREGAEIMKEAALHTDMYDGDHLTAHFLQIPKVFDSTETDLFRSIAGTTFSICSKVIERYREDPAYRELFPFSGELKELILLPTYYSCPLPMARFDIFFNEKTYDFKFCEFNTDGTAAQNDDRTINILYKNNPAHQQVLSDISLHTFELFDSWVSTFKMLYDEYRAVRRPDNDPGDMRAVVVDFFDKGRVLEFNEFARHFEKAGYPCDVCDIREFTYDGKVLRTKDGHPVNAVFRRAVTADVIERYDEVQPFIQAVKDGNVCLIGSFCTQLIHNKWIFNVLCRDETKAFLTEEERYFVDRHIPLTLSFSGSEDLLREVKANKDNYMLKPMDEYGSSGVFAGPSVASDSEWSKICDDVFNKDYICQEYATQYRTTNIDFAYGDGRFREYINMPGLYTYGGRFAGIYARMSAGNIIAYYDNSERSVPVYYIEEQ